MGVHISLLAVLSVLFLACVLVICLVSFPHGQLTLAQAQQYSQKNSLPIFVHHTRTNLYTPLVQPIGPQKQSADAAAPTLLLEEDGSSAKVDFSAGDELVYLSPSQQAPASLTLRPIAKLGYTYPLLLQTEQDGQTVTELATPSVYFSLPAGNTQTFQFYDKNAPVTSTLSAADGPLLLDGSSAADYLQAHTTQLALTVSSNRFYSNAPAASSNEYLLDATASLGSPAGLRPSKAAGKTRLTVGCYSGTVYRSFSLSACCLWLASDSAKAFAQPLALTQDGYAQIDLTGLSSPTGCYTVQLPGSTPRYLAFSLTE